MQAVSTKGSGLSTAASTDRTDVMARPTSELWGSMDSQLHRDEGIAGEAELEASREESSAVDFDGMEGTRLADNRIDSIVPPIIDAPSQGIVPRTLNPESSQGRMDIDPVGFSANVTSVAPSTPPPVPTTGAVGGGRRRVVKKKEKPKV